MPNFPEETGMTDETWDRVRIAMREINLRQESIRRLVQEISEQTDELSRVLWPRTDLKRLPQKDGGR